MLYNPKRCTFTLHHKQVARRLNMDFLIVGTLVIIIAWIALRPRFGLGQTAFLNKTTNALAELGLDTETFSPKLKQMYEADCLSFREANGKQACPYEMACDFFLKSMLQYPELTIAIVEPDRALVKAMVIASSWRNEQLNPKYADMFTLEIKLHLTKGNILQNELAEQA